jgi:vacuolar protein 8
MTLEYTQVRAKKCMKLNYGGKLQMQSNLDSLIGKLICQLLIQIGIMCKNPLASYRITFKSTKEAIRWVIQNLFSHLQIGGIECKQKALNNMI